MTNAFTHITSAYTQGKKYRNFAAPGGRWIREKHTPIHITYTHTNLYTGHMHSLDKKYSNFAASGRR
jgi:hypothetical protein